jgi:hypothetical protein
MGLYLNGMKGPRTILSTQGKPTMRFMHNQVALVVGPMLGVAALTGLYLAWSKYILLDEGILFSSRSSAREYMQLVYKRLILAGMIESGVVCSGPFVATARLW